jgi:hypothetical protein
LVGKKKNLTNDAKGHGLIARGVLSVNFEGKNVKVVMLWRIKCIFLKVLNSSPPPCAYVLYISTANDRII